MGRKKITDIAQSHGIPVGQLLDRLHAAGYSVDRPSRSIDEAQALAAAGLTPRGEEPRPGAAPPQSARPPAPPRPAADDDDDEWVARALLDLEERALGLAATVDFAMSTDDGADWLAQFKAAKRAPNRAGLHDPRFIIRLIATERGPEMRRRFDDAAATAARHLSGILNAAHHRDHRRLAYRDVRRAEEMLDTLTGVSPGSL